MAGVRVLPRRPHGGTMSAGRRGGPMLTTRQKTLRKFWYATVRLDARLCLTRS